MTTIDKGNFDRESQNAVETFLEKFKKKFEVPGWRKCVKIWDQILEFQKIGDEGPKKYLERWLELEAKIQNAGKPIAKVYQAVHFIERAGLQDTTKQSILTMIDLDDKSTVLEQMKKAFETLLPNFHKDEETNTSFWGYNERHS